MFPGYSQLAFPNIRQPLNKHAPPRAYWSRKRGAYRLGSGVFEFLRWRRLAPRAKLNNGRKCNGLVSAVLTNTVSRLEPPKCSSIRAPLRGTVSRSIATSANREITAALGIVGRAYFL